MDDRSGRRKRFEAAKALAAAGEHGRALAIVDDILAGEPDDFDAWFVRARLRLAAGDQTAASDAIARAVAIAPKPKALALAERIATVERSDGDEDRQLALVDQFVEARDFPALCRLIDTPAPPVGPLVHAAAEARLFYHHQCFGEAIAAADRALALLGDGDRLALRFTLETVRARSLITVGRPGEVRFTAGLAGPKPTSLLRRELDLWWRSDPARGLAAAEALASGERPLVRAAVLACTIPLTLGDPARARRNAEALEAQFVRTGREVPGELMLAVARVAQEVGDAGIATTWRNRYFASHALEAPAPAWQPGYCFDDLACPVPASADGPLVTVIVTAFNAAATLPTALRSLAGQSHAALEILVVDDRSTDDTLAVARGMAAADPRIRVIANPLNIGTYASKNRALREARGTFFTILDADDWAHPRRIERHLAFHAEQPELAATASDWVRVTEDGRPLVRPSLGVFTHRNPGSAFMRVADMRGVLGGYEPMRIDADNDHWLRLLAAFGTPRVVRIRQPLTVGRHHEGSLTRSGAGAQDGELYSPVRSAYRARALAWRRAGGSLRVDPDAPVRFPDLLPPASGD